MQAYTARMTRAMNSPLSPGEHTVERATPVLQPNGRYRIKWTVMYEDGRKSKRETWGATKSEARRRAKRIAEDLLKTNGGVWKLSHRMSDYLEKVTVPDMEKADFRDMTRERYDAALRFLRGQCRKCNRAGTPHEYGLDKHTIGSATKPRAVQRLFTEIAEKHGLATAKSCRTVWNKYIAKHLVLDGLMASNPMSGQRLPDLTGVEKTPRMRGGKALPREDYDRVLEWLLAADPADWLVSHKKHGWIWEPHVQIATHLAGIDIALLQMTTGLRQSEARMLTWDLVSLDEDGVMSIHVPEHIAKSGVPRTVLVLDQRVAERLLERCDAQQGSGYIVGAPMDTEKFWNRMRCGEVSRKLYVRMAEELQIPILSTERSHMWRTTLRSFYEGKVPEAVLNSQFGHSTAVASLYYTDATDLRELALAAKLTQVA